MSSSSATLSAENHVAASLAKRSPHPYSSIALSPDRRHAVTACKDTLQILQVGPLGIKHMKTIPMSQHFSTATPTSSAGQRRPLVMGNIREDARDSFVLEAFGLGNRHVSSHEAAPSMINNVVITDVAWSFTLSSEEKESSSDSSPVSENTSLIAAAGSNGVIVVWNASTLLEGIDASSAGGKGRAVPVTSVAAPPEAVLSQHVRAVNRLAWHPKRAGLLVSASQDATVLLWERRRVSEESTERSNRKQQDSSAAPGLRLLFGGMVSQSTPKPRSYSWACRAKFEPKSEAVRDIRWSPFYDDVFALVTCSGSLIAYNMHVPPRALVKMTAHSGDATTLDWHPTVPGIIATGGASDRSVKVWDVERYLSLKKDDSYMASNVNTMTSVATESSSETDRSTTPSGSLLAAATPAMAVRSYSPSSNTLNSISRHHKGSTPKAMLHVLAISASVTRVRWRPPAFDPLESSMMAVATAPIKGASAGGAGILALWSYHRPFMPLSVVQGHKDGAVTDFEWLETPVNDARQTSSSAKLGTSKDSKRGYRRGTAEPGADPLYRSSSSRLPGNSAHEVDAMLYDNSEVEEVESAVDIWQHVLSVGRDGRCLIQSFVRGDRPISRVPPSCFAMANLSPFQKGYGSLQLFSICQPVPSDPKSDYFLTGLRRDSETGAAPGIFREMPISSRESSSDTGNTQISSIVQERFPPSSPELAFNVVDQGVLDGESRPVGTTAGAVTVAPEVVHLSRFASQYILYPNEQLTTRASICRHNGSVADRLLCGNLAHMWNMVASMLESSHDTLPDPETAHANAVQFVVLPTVKNLLVEKGEQGDVQTCVALCEVLEIVNADQTVRVPGLELGLVREWYLSYIDLLRDMCLFSHATFLIRSCRDPFVSSLNQQSTTIHESCPRCGKPMPPGNPTDGGSSRRTCKSCRRRVGLCFLCHEPVKGMYVWCPGCGHGGHLEHALQWFGGLTGKPVREFCPTGCGHRCNGLQQLISFPRTESLKDFGTLQDSVFEMMPPGLV